MAEDTENERSGEQDEDGEPEGSSHTYEVYGSAGLEIFDTVMATPIIVPSTSGKLCLFGMRVRFYDSTTQMTYFDKQVPYEVLLSIVSSLVEVLDAAGSTLAAGSYKMDTLLVPPERLQEQAAKILSHGANLPKHLRAVLDIQEETNEETS